MICTSGLLWRTPAIAKGGPDPHPDARVACKWSHNADEHDRSVGSTKHHKSWGKVCDLNTIAYCGVNSSGQYQ